VRAVLYRELYRGEIIWNKTRKRDRWGQTHQTSRPASEWMRIDAPDLRIVTDTLWAAAHARLEATRATYLRTTRGPLWGRPASGLASTYLLTGIARCGACGSGLEVRSGTHGKRRAFYYSCSSYYRRGRTVCPNRYEIPMTTANDAVLNALLTEVLTPDRFKVVAERLIAKARATQEAPAGRQVAQARQVVVKLVEGRVTFAPETQGDREGFRFTATGTIAKLIEGHISGQFSSLQAVASPPGHATLSPFRLTGKVVGRRVA